MRRRIHITGASCSGATTLGATLAERLSVPHFDTDDFYWYPSRPKFERKRAVKERIRLLRAALLGVPGWVLSGSLNPWGNELGATCSFSGAGTKALRPHYRSWWIEPHRVYELV